MVSPYRYAFTDLHDFSRRVFEALDIPPHEASIIADALLYADLRGIDSHGVAHLDVYVQRFRLGSYVAKRRIDIVHETPSTALIDAGGGMGPPAGVHAMHLAMAKAKDVGTGWVAVRNSHHYGAAGYYVCLALEHDMIGLCLSNAGPVVLPTFGLEPLVGTNPIALAIPAGREPPFVLDMATSVKAVGKLEVLVREGRQAPQGWFLRSDGSMGVDPHDLPQLRLVEHRGGMLPLGGLGEETSGYKGYGLSLGVELLSAVLAGDISSPFMQLTPGCVEPPISHFFGAMRVDAFRSAEAFKADVDRVLARIKSSPKMPGCDRIWIAGEKEWECLQDRQMNGIPLHSRVIEDIRRLAEELELIPPEPISVHNGAPGHTPVERAVPSGTIGQIDANA